MFSQSGVWLACAGALAFLITWLSGYYWISFLHKVKFGQPIKEIGPTWHASKKGTPTMGGLLFITAAVVTLGLVMVCTGGANDTLGFEEYVPAVNGKLIAGLLMALLYAFCGFLDDFAKVKRQTNNGLTALQKLILQTLIAVSFLVTLVLVGNTSTTLWIPYAGNVELGIFYYPLMTVLIVGTVNAVNLHDGIDGLLGSTGLVFSSAMLVLFALLKMFGGALLAVVTLAGCAGFLVWNRNPAKVFMGDLGSHYLGGIFVAMAFYLNKPILLLPMGIIYYIEMLSVVLQVISFKLTGKRIFKMSPIHHHFEMCGWSENKICIVFSLITAVGCVAGVLLGINS